MSTETQQGQEAAAPPKGTTRSASQELRELLEELFTCPLPQWSDEELVQGQSMLEARYRKVEAIGAAVLPLEKQQAREQLLQALSGAVIAIGLEVVKRGLAELAELFKRAEQQEQCRRAQEGAEGGTQPGGNL